ncbi:MAG: hypothetical protein A3C08_01685 [Candidatus Taylorbacteria bacterium RIFCSPHIGHO2_02_FULL_47_18]|uniref:DoxX family protein n=1 Tax=Candidatus Taylorbacteria bacterium RIFCSPLOWO2_01_FULL_48_100 TaxID=1802322 RepID=A0A1G2NFT1_9BACT|nr:MAG: hypothetical protein A2670_01305 [Candidatus Taylorbacteria bacterium RIFCSPHIGHO2_01_FULL_48_38]OHA28462.1 MAG: hypothetical protein A3C08_01685 [Candidatus Taylorbacteria bacterium RIFCSPHIGHO2_02_FULL_47_18]OHA34934.1 MAG: hypothetical protein A2938_02205 [Candidatus Taylorbacteria bacterium RIFCSPLOWO2_01_FULL_48_100]OHA40217.1 MAG: hypothetical protein A3J31_01395 [Candidatus Taylorbacteria bacterium RIFCSPLOWO2_02_FULL_48_16]OHA45449.1 MAG: hypothetical protein A3H13_01450 [Candid
MCKSSWRKWCTTDSGLLALRIGIGAIFVYTGWLKVSDLSVTVTQFSGMGFAPFWAYIVSFVEIIGGVAVLLGIYTRVSAKLLAIIMLVAVYVSRGNLLMALTPISLFFSLLALALSGGGKYSVLHKGCCGCGCILPCSCGKCDECKSCEGSDVK